MDTEKLKYPIGKFEMPAWADSSVLTVWIDDIQEFPNQLAAEVSNLSDDELSLTYRPEGWSIRQLVHHCADSHMNGFIRHKLTLTEEDPVIKPYRQGEWAKHPDVNTPISNSLNLLAGMTARWVALLRSLTPDGFKRTYIHPEDNKRYSLMESVGLYAWHGKHHLAHIKQAKKLMTTYELRITGKDKAP